MTAFKEKEMMRAAMIYRFGGPEVVSVRTVPVPEPKPDQILIRVASAGVSRWELVEREGIIATAAGIIPKFPWILGTEGAGNVVAVGEKMVNEFQVGDRVYGLNWATNPKLGFFAEYTALAAEWTAPVPSNIPIEEVGALIIDGAVALRALDEVLRLKPEENLMVFDASGDVGHLAVQLARRMGARVFGITSGEKGIDLAERLGAEVAVDGHDGDVTSSAREFTPRGFDAALFTAGGEVAERTLATMREGGRLAHPFGASLSNVPSTVRVLSYMEGNYWPKMPHALISKLKVLIETGRFEVHLDKTFSLDQLLDAYQALSSHYLGKLAVLPYK